MSPYPPLLCDVNYGLNFEREELRDQGIQDGRGIYYRHSGLLNALQQPELDWPDHSWASKGRAARAEGPAVVTRGAIGFFGFYAGPQVHIVDQWALGDPLLARLPAELDWQIGHFTRKIPAGYLETLRSGQNVIRNQNLAAYYDKLALVTRDDLFDLRRLGEIWSLNTGKYDALLAAYPPIFQVNLSDHATAGPESALWSEANNLAQYMGIQLNLNQPSHAQRAEISLVQHAGLAADELRDYRLVYLQGNSPVAEQILQLPPQIPGSGLVRTIELPPEAATQGYTSIRVSPIRGDSLPGTIYSIKSIRLLEVSDQ